jgi:hypothetical protein
MNKKDKEILRLALELKSKEADILTLKVGVKRLQDELDDFKNTRDDIIEDCGFEIDYKGLDAFSIERTVVLKDRDKKYDREKTVIGHLVDGKIQEWSFSCSRKTHERLVLELKSYIRMKNQA